MQSDKRKRLEDDGWRFGDTDDFLGTNMITPDQFKSIDDTIDEVNLKKIDMMSNLGWAVCIPSPDDEKNAQEFIELWRDRPGVDVGEAQ